MKAEPTEDFYSVPIRRSRWPSFWIALMALAVSLMLAAGFCGLLIWSSNGVGGTAIIAPGRLCVAAVFPLTLQ